MTLVIICGATATGKSDLAVALASKIGGQVVNADSMQLYSGMDIGTAKLTFAERNGIEHHLLDVADVGTDVNVAWYQERARAKIDQLLGAGIPTIIVGGTGLYIKAIVDDLNFPDTDPIIREKLNEEAEANGGDQMHQRLAALDPAAAMAIPKENVRRVIRALEVIEITGQPFTANLPRADSTRYPQALHFGLVMDREKLHDRIDQRVERMWQAGLVQEVEALIDQGLLTGKTARAALGYAQVIAYKAGSITEKQAKEETKRVTRAYVRRQETWFSRDRRITWLREDSDRLGIIEAAILSS
jgi:tRNA dimethylallyltransferase